MQISDFENKFDKYNLPATCEYYWELLEVAQFKPFEAEKFKSKVKQYLKQNKVELDID